MDYVRLSRERGRHMCSRPSSLDNKKFHQNIGEFAGIKDPVNSILD
jgi:hypothetical protein